ncbi:Vacuolar protease A [Linnemannia gamsii]|uniref:Vacuolar protease A n=1 Tax=Linnemannia gamsii TaxID=64522 RepID=A0ABQ7JZD5_9FUNG|nr:Vacuolar protease A [Linnemannia gamsii]
MKCSLLITGLVSLAIACQAKMLRLKLEQQGGNPVVDAFDSLVSHSGSDDSAQTPFSREQLGYPSRHHIPINKNEYYSQTVTVELGNPPQSFRLGLDLSSGNSYVVSSECIQIACMGSRMYNASASRTNHRDGRTFTLPDSPQGIISMDTLYIGGIEVPHQEFGEALSFRFFGPGLFGFDGSLGLAYDDNRPGSSVTGRFSFVSSLMASRDVDQPVFTLYLGSTRPNGPTGELTIGGLDHRRFSGPMIFHNIVKRGQWVVSLDGATFQNGDRVSRILFDRNETRAMVNPDYPFIHLANQAAYHVNERLAATRKNNREYYHRPCERIEELEPVAITIQRYSYWFTPQEYFIKSRDGVTCISIFQQIDGTTDDERVARGYDAVLGAVFLQKYYSAYDYSSHRIGFGLAT